MLGLCASLAFAAIGPSALLPPEAAAQSTSRAWLGIELAARKDGKPGVTARHVMRSSPSDTAGLKDGDVVLQVDAKAMKSPADVIGEVRAHKPGDVLEIGFERGGTERKAKVTLETFPGADEILRRDKIGTFAPSLAGLVSVQGVAPASVRSLRGKVVVLDFWAGWCGVCKLVAPVLNGWQEKRGPQGLVVVGVSSDTAEVATKATPDFGIKYAVAVDKDQGVFPGYGVSSLPTMFVLDKRGVVRGLEVGFDPAGLARMDALITALLAEKAPED